MSNSFQVNPQLDPAAVAQSFSERGIVQVADIFAPNTADRLHRCLRDEIPWGLAYEQGGKSMSVPAEELARPHSPSLRAADQVIFAEARSGYAYRYFSYPILDAYLHKWPNEVPLLHYFLEFLNSDAWLPLIRAITGIAELRKCDAQASLYTGNCFLHRHSDFKDEEGWRVAYVLNFTRDWRADFGGTLNFLDENGNTTLGLLPRFNTLNLFSVPRWHAVSYVPPYAPPNRLAITGWLRDR